MIGAAGRVAGLLAIAALQIYWYQHPGPLLLKIASAVFTVLCLASPAAGLLLFAAVAPVSSVLEFAGGGTVPRGLFLEQLALALATGVLSRFHERGPRTHIGPPAIVVATVALASAMAMWPAAAAATAPVGLDVDPQTVWRFLLDRRDAYHSPVWSAVFAAITVAEAAVVGWVAERTVRRAPQLAMRLVGVLLAGHTAAAVLGIGRVIEIAVVRADGFRSLPEMLMTARLSEQMDVHAAGSALLLAGVAGYGLLGGSRLRRVGIGVLLFLVAVGLWISGSRIAIALGGLTAVLALGRWALTSLRGRVVIGVAAAAVVAGCVWFATLYPSTRYSALSVSLQSRLLMAKAATQMFQTAPIFGIGIDRFHRTSGGVVGAELTALIGYGRENAHNNFLQVLAEQGLIGLLAILWWLGVVFVAGWRSYKSQRDRLRAALLVAVAVCVCTWMMGHPLLVREFAYVFWLYTGILLATTLPPTAVLPNRLACVFVAAVLVIVPFRAVALRNAADLEHMGFGLSIWHHDDSQRYRRAAPNFALYLPANGRTAVLPVRRSPESAGSVVVDARVGGSLVKTFEVGGNEWQVIELSLPALKRRFELVEFTVRRQSPTSEVTESPLRVGLPSFR